MVQSNGCNDAVIPSKTDPSGHVYARSWGREGTCGALMVKRPLHDSLPERVRTRWKWYWRRMRRLVASLAFTLLLGCSALRPSRLGEDAVSVLGTSSGWLHRGASLPDRGVGFDRARPGEDTRFGVPRLVGALMQAAAQIDALFPGGFPLRIGDLGSARGGRHARHRSHRAGRDVDILYYLTDATGRSVAPRGRVAFSRFGLAADAETNEIVVFDEARNWALVRALLTDPQVEVQWIFCSRGVKSRLLRYALVHEPDASLLSRANYILAQPMNARPHDDHFHVRVLCSAMEARARCMDVAPIWPWLRSREEPLGEDATDADTLELLNRGFSAPD